MYAFGNLFPSYQQSSSKYQVYQGIIINKIFRSITNNHSLPQSQQLTQATDSQEEKIRMSINLPYVEGISEQLQHILDLIK